MPWGGVSCTPIAAEDFQSQHVPRWQVLKLRIVSRQQVGVGHHAMPKAFIFLLDVPVMVVKLGRAPLAAS